MSVIGFPTLPGGEDERPERPSDTDKGRKAGGLADSAAQALRGA